MGWLKKVLKFLDVDGNKEWTAWEKEEEIKKEGNKAGGKKRMNEEQDVWVFNKEGFLSIASNEFEKRKLEEVLGVKPRKARFIYL